MEQDDNNNNNNNNNSVSNGDNDSYNNDDYSEISAGGLDSLEEGLKTINSQRQYRSRLSYFFSDLNLPGVTIEEQSAFFLKKGKQDKKWAYNSIKSFINHYKQKVENKIISPTTLTNYIVPIRFICDMNDLELNWKRLTRGMPEPRAAANDSSPTLEEVRKLCEHSDRRVKLVVYFGCSGGIRAGAWEFLKWKHVKPQYKADFLKWKKRQLANEQKPHASNSALSNLVLL